MRPRQTDTPAGRSAPCARCSCSCSFRAKSGRSSALVGARFRAMLLEHSKARAFVCLRQPSYFLFAWPKRKITKEKGHPAWRLPPIHGRQVREPGPGFSTGHPALAKRHRHPCRCPLRGLSAPTHRRARAPGRAAGHRGPHSVIKRRSEAEQQPEQGVALLLFCF